MRCEFSMAVENVIMQHLMKNPKVYDDIRNYKRQLDRGFVSGFEAFKYALEFIDEEFVRNDLIRDPTIRHIQYLCNLDDDYVCDNYGKVLQEFAFSFITGM